MEEELEVLKKDKLFKVFKKAYEETNDEDRKKRILKEIKAMKRIFKVYKPAFDSLK